MGGSRPCTDRPAAPRRHDPRRVAWRAARNAFPAAAWTERNRCGGLPAIGLPDSRTGPVRRRLALGHRLLLRVHQSSVSGRTSGLGMQMRLQGRVRLNRREMSNLILTTSVERPAKGEFRLRVLGGYARHDARPGGLVHDAGHRWPCSASVKSRQGSIRPELREAIKGYWAAVQPVCPRALGTCPRHATPTRRRRVRRKMLWRENSAGSAALCSLFDMVALRPLIVVCRVSER